MSRAKLFEKTKYFIVDMDGTFYLSDTIIEGSADFLRSLSDMGMDFFFFTNNSSNNTAVCCERLAKMGFPVGEEKIIVSTQVTIDYIKRNYSGMSVYLLGNERMTNDFIISGIDLTHEKPDLVVLGFDTTLTYEKIRRAANFIADGAIYIATHPDINCPVKGGFMPDTGSMIELFAASTGKRPIVTGKPMTATVDYITNLLGCGRDELCFVGDRLETDIAIGFNHGIPCVLVLTGVTSMQEHENSKIKADFVVPSISCLKDYLI